MSNFEKVICSSCDCSYLTRQSRSQCPNCGEMNYDWTFGLGWLFLLVGLCIGLIIFFMVPVVCGPLFYATHAVQKKWKIYHQYIVIFLAVSLNSANFEMISGKGFSLPRIEDEYKYSTFIIALVYLCAIAYSIKSIYKYHRGVNGAVDDKIDKFAQWILNIYKRILKYIISFFIALSEDEE